MRILFVAPYVPSLIRVRPLNLIRELSRSNEIDVLATGFDPDPDAVSQLSAYCSSVNVIRLSRRSSALNCVVPAVKGDSLQACVCRSAEFDRVLREMLATNRYDVVHVEHLRAAHTIGLIPANTPTVFDSVDSISLLLERTRASSHSLAQRLLARLELPRVRRYEADVLPRFDEVAVTSPVDAGSLLTVAPSARVSVVPNGVDLEQFAPVEGERWPATLVFTGKMSYHANASAALYFVKQIWPAIRADHPETRLVVAGSDPPRPIRQLAVDPSITVTGRVPSIAAILGRATVAISPMTVKVGVQNKILEAMAMGVPVVSTVAGAEGLGARHGDDLLVSRSPAEFARQVCDLLESDALRAMIGRNGRRYVEANHLWSDAAKRMEHLYSLAIARHDGQ